MQKCKCGSEDIITMLGSDGNSFIYCNSCQRMVKGKTIKEAEEKWNTTTPHFDNKVGKRPMFKKGLASG